MFTSTIIFILTVSGAVASPVNILSRDLKNTTQYPTIHSSCNSTQRRMLETGLQQAWEVAEFAQTYTKKNGPSDPVFQMYFGNNNPNAWVSVMGIWESFLYSDKNGVIFRCDDIDGNCHQAGWRGHWRGNNATSETVICDASYTDRKPNEAMCMFGYQLAKTAPSMYWSIDLIHRFFHVPQITNSAVNHYADNLEEVFELAAHNSTYSPFDSDALQYYAAHVFINEKVKGGNGCLGDLQALQHGHSASSSTSAGGTSSTSSAATANQTAGKDCHTHADGTVHCV